MNKLWEVHYRIEFRCGMDAWRIFGIKDEGTEIMPSTPISFNEEAMTFTTKSGSVYQIMSLRGDRQKFLDQIKKDIINGTYERC